MLVSAPENVDFDQVVPTSMLPSIFDQVLSYYPSIHTLSPSLRLGAITTPLLHSRPTMRRGLA